LMALGDNGGSSPNYEPNSFGGPKQNPRYTEKPIDLHNATVARWDHREHDGDYYTQAGNLFRMLDQGAKDRLCANIASTLSTVPERIRTLQISHFAKCDPAYGEGVAKACETASKGKNIEQREAELIGA
jgi:catalase